MTGIIGNGLLASAFDPCAIASIGATVFASGVSNSQATDTAAFAREHHLLSDALKRQNGGPLVYFSTCSVTDPHRSKSKYATHKLEMEALVASRPGNVILRLPQVVGHTNNRHTLTNFLADRISRGLPLEVWVNATRCLIDVDSAAALTTCLLRTGQTDILHDLAPPEIVTMPELVNIMENVLGKRAQCKFVDQGGGSTIDSSLALSLAPDAGEDFSPGYTLRTIFKYYGKHDAG